MNTKIRDSKYCQYNYSDLVLETSPDERLALPLRRRWWDLKRFVWFTANSDPHMFVSKTIPEILADRLPMLKKDKRKYLQQGASSDFKQGEFVEVRPIKEILLTLDAQGKLRGLRFTPEMARYCGRKLKVYKKLNKILLETTGELRKIRTSTFLLEGVFCDGSAHGGCDRSCFCFWRREWLRKVEK